MDAESGGRRFPHTRGGEPNAFRMLTSGPKVFPTPVGVNRLPAIPNQAAPRFPHTRGGEPDIFGVSETAATVFPTPVGVNRSHGVIFIGFSAFSPHPWG